MKKIYLLSFSFLTICSSVVNAQISKGTKTIGGGITFSSSKNESGTSTVIEGNSVYVAPTFGIAIKENLLLSGELLFNNSKTTQELSELKSDRYGVGVFIRKYHELGKSGFYVFGQARAAVVLGSQKNKNGSSEVKSDLTNISFSAQPGISYAVSKKFHIETSLANLFYVDYSIAKNKTQGIQSKNFVAGANLGANTELQVGFRFFF